MNVLMKRHIVVLFSQKFNSKRSLPLQQLQISLFEWGGIPFFF
jgi:hypothetical protein